MGWYYLMGVAAIAFIVWCFAKMNSAGFKEEASSEEV